MLYGGDGDDYLWSFQDSGLCVVLKKGDNFYGGGGDDYIDTSIVEPRYANEADIIDGGKGDDYVDSSTLAKATGKDRVHCSAGFDRVLADHDDRVSRDCERVRRD